MATLTMLVHGDPGVGKSWLGDTAPEPKLVLDAEGRARYLPSEPKITWDPASQAPPEAPVDGNWRTCVANVTDFNTMSTAFQWLQSGQHPFRSVVIDSLMEVQKRCVDNIAPMKQLEFGDWGELLRRLESLVRTYRDLVLLPGPVECVIYTAGSRAVDGKIQPLVQGQLRDTLPYYLDCVGYYYVTHTPEGGMSRQLLVQPAPNIVAKDGTGRLPGPIIAEPNLSQLFELLNGNTQPEVAA